MTKIWVAGEVLVDLIPAQDGDAVIEGKRYRAVIGGGPANTAKTLARLGQSVDFLGGLSSDRYGHMAWTELERDGVGLDLVLESDQPTAKAIVSLDELGSPSYRFEIDRSVTFDFSRDWLPSGVPSIIYLGTLAAIVEPGRDELLHWVREKKEYGSLIVFDPNVRPAFLSDRKRYRAMIEEWIEISDLVKVSAEDLRWLYLEMGEAEEVSSRWLHLGPSLVVLTRGADGMEALRADENIRVPGIAVEVVDTVGAGDTVGAVLCEALALHGLDALRGELLRTVLMRAAKAAAITCSRQGANPPSRHELED